MPDLMSKIFEMALLKGMRTLTAYAMLAVSYTFLTGLELVGEEKFWFLTDKDVGAWRVFKIFAIFILKSIYVCSIVHVILTLLESINIDLADFLYRFASLIFISISLFGVFGRDRVPELAEIDLFIFYSFAVWGVHFQSEANSMNSKFNEYNK